MVAHDPSSARQLRSDNCGLRDGHKDLALAGASVVCSWSGGKDSALALHEAVLAGAKPRLLATMMTETGTRSRSHGLERCVLEAQPVAVGIPIRFASAT